MIKLFYFLKVKDKRGKIFKGLGLGESEFAHLRENFTFEKRDTIGIKWISICIFKTKKERIWTLRNIFIKKTISEMKVASMTF